VAAFAPRTQAALRYRELWREARDRARLPDPPPAP
jgi:hypothetical protein